MLCLAFGGSGVAFAGVGVWVCVTCGSWGWWGGLELLVFAVPAAEICVDGRLISRLGCRVFETVHTKAHLWVAFVSLRCVAEV